MRIKKYRFDVISEISGRQEPYIYLFQDRETALKWYSKHGKWHRAMGRNLILTECQTDSMEAELEDVGETAQDC